MNALVRRKLFAPFGASLLLLAFRSAAGRADAPSEELLLGTTYPLEASVSFPAALYHWVDSIAGSSGGKTIPAYRKEYLERFGDLDDRDIAFLQGFLRARAETAGALPVEEVRGLTQPRSSRLLGIFCEADNVDDAMEAARAELAAENRDALRAALDHFLPRYREIWRDGAVAREFLSSARRDPSRARLASRLATIADFFGVSPAQTPRPRVVLVPVPYNYGTHAEAVGRDLLVEVRQDEGLADQASVIVHENAHFLFYRIDEERRRSLAAFARHADPRGEAAWNTLLEALPTALGQGVVDEEFRPRSWSEAAPWYHTPEVDRYAKALFPMVKRALARGLRFDEAFLKAALMRYPKPASERGASRR